jgi:hypothetical protein
MQTSQSGETERSAALRAAFAYNGAGVTRALPTQSLFEKWPLTANRTLDSSARLQRPEAASRRAGGLMFRIAGLMFGLMVATLVSWHLALVSALA